MMSSKSCGLLLITAASLLSRSADAIPAFARTHGVPCSTCHTSITRRNEFGDAFRKAGYHWPGVEDARPDAEKSLIDMSGTSALLGSLPSWIPLSIAGTLSGAYTLDPTSPSKFVLGSPGINILFGSAFGDHFSVFGTWNGKGAPNELFIHAAKIGGLPELNLRLGLFEQTTTLAKNNDALLAGFMVGTSEIGGHVVSQGRLGAEASGALFGRTFWALGAVQNGALGSDVDFYYHVSQKIGGITLLGDEPDVDLEAPSLWDDVIVTLAHWAYFGRVEENDADRTIVRRLALEAKVRLHWFELFAGAMLGLDKDLYVQANHVSLTWFGELSCSPLTWLTFVYSYQYQDAASFQRENQRHDVGAVLLLLENVRTRVSFTYTDDRVKNEAVELQALVAF